MRRRAQEGAGQAPRIRHAVFDLGGVLFAWRPQKTLARLYAHPARRQQIDEQILQHPDWKDLDRGTIDEQQALARFQSRTQQTPAELSQLLHEIRHDMRPMEDSWQIIDWLVRSKIQLYILSNMSLGTFAVLTQRYQRWGPFQDVIISAHHGLMKPESAFFQLLLSRHGLQAAQCVFIDDLADNVQGAIDMGLHGIRFDNAAHCRQQIQQLM